MRLTLAVLAALLAAAPAAEACVAPPAEPGIVITVCAGSATITGPGTVTDGVYRDADPGRLLDARVTGDRGEARVYVARLDREGVLMESRLDVPRLTGAPHVVVLYLDFALLELEDGTDVDDAGTVSRRVFGSPRTPLSEPAATRVSSACFAYRRAVPAPFMRRLGAEFVLRFLDRIRRGRAQLTRRLAAAPATELDRRFLDPLAGSLRRGNRYLLSVRRRWRAGRDVDRVIRAYGRGLRREERLRERLGLSECEPLQPPAAAS